MLKRLSIMLIAALLSCLTAIQAGAADDQQFQTCNEAYSKGDFKAAVDCYLQIQQAQGFSAGLNYNLANSYAQLGQIGPAVLNYERARRLAPGDSDIRGNLSFIRQESGLFAPELSTLEALLDSINLERSALIGLAALLLLTTTAVISVKQGGKRKTLTRSVATIFALSCICAVVMTWKNYQSYNPSVVIRPDARLLISPFDGAGAVGAMQEGRLVYPSKSHGDYVFIKDETGRTGWLPNSAITTVIPEG